MTTSTINTLQTPAELEATRLAFSRSTVLPFSPRSPSAKDKAIDAAKAKAEARFQAKARAQIQSQGQNIPIPSSSDWIIPRPSDNELASEFQWTKNRDLDRASLDYWVRVPPMPDITKDQYMAATRSAARTKSLLKAAISALHVPEARRSNQEKRDLTNAVKEYTASVFIDKGKWDLDKETHDTYEKVCKMMNRQYKGPAWKVIPQSERPKPDWDWIPPVREVLQSDADAVDYALYKYTPCGPWDSDSEVEQENYTIGLEGFRTARQNREDAEKKREEEKENMGEEEAERRKKLEEWETAVKEAAAAREEWEREEEEEHVYSY